MLIQINKKYFVVHGTQSEDINKNKRGSKSSVECPKYYDIFSDPLYLINTYIIYTNLLNYSFKFISFLYFL